MPAEAYTNTLSPPLSLYPPHPAQDWKILWGNQPAQEKMAIATEFGGFCQWNGWVTAWKKQNRSSAVKLVKTIDRLQKHTESNSCLGASVLRMNTHTWTSRPLRKASKIRPEAKINKHEERTWGETEKKKNLYK